MIFSWRALGTAEGYIDNLVEKQPDLPVPCCVNDEEPESLNEFECFAIDYALFCFALLDNALQNYLFKYW